MTTELKNIFDSLTKAEDTFTFKIPESHPSAFDSEGNRVQVEKTFSYSICKTEAEALQVIDAKKMNIVDMVNDLLKANARSSAYQSATLVYKPSEVSQSDIVERMVRDYIRLGIEESAARAQVAAILNVK